MPRNLSSASAATDDDDQDKNEEEGAEENDDDYFVKLMAQKEYEAHIPCQGTALGGSWVVTSGVISRIAIVITHIRGLIIPLITAHEPPSRP